MALSCKLRFARFSVELRFQDRAECGKNALYIYKNEFYFDVSSCEHRKNWQFGSLESFKKNYAYFWTKQIFTQLYFANAGREEQSKVGYYHSFSELEVVKIEFYEPLFVLADTRH